LVQLLLQFTVGHSNFKVVLQLFFISDVCNSRWRQSVNGLMISGFVLSGFSLFLPFIALLRFLWLCEEKLSKIYVPMVECIYCL